MAMNNSQSVESITCWQEKGLLLATVLLHTPAVSRCRTTHMHIHSCGTTQLYLPAQVQTPASTPKHLADTRVHKHTHSHTLAAVPYVTDDRDYTL